jgi:hypothetical protein
MYGATYVSTSVSQYSAIHLRSNDVVGVFVGSSTGLHPDEEMLITYEVAHSHEPGPSLSVLMIQRTGAKACSKGMPPMWRKTSTPPARLPGSSG